MRELEDIKKAYVRIKPFIKKTPIISSSTLNENMSGHEILFKADNIQITGAFKIRGVLNALISLKEQGKLPKKIIAYSSGNHAQAVAWAAKKFGIEAKLYMTSFSSPLKQKAVIDYGAELILTRTRIEAEAKSFAESQEEGNYFLHPSDNDMVIDGAATICYESLIDMDKRPDAVFAACGGGALISGTYLACNHLDKKIKIYAAEPQIANDASISYNSGKIFGFTESPKTIADGARTLKISERTFEYIKKIDGFFEITEEEIIYWTAWLNHLLKTNCEPTSALPMAAAQKWLSKQTERKAALVILSGGNTDQESLKKIWKKDHLQTKPSVNISIA